MQSDTQSSPAKGTAEEQMRGGNLEEQAIHLAETTDVSPKQAPGINKNAWEEGSPKEGQ